jgi:hypothetical protein
LDEGDIKEDVCFAVENGEGACGGVGPGLRFPERVSVFDVENMGVKVGTAKL